LLEGESAEDVAMQIELALFHEGQLDVVQAARQVKQERAKHG
jgi:hypothetical protein